jgi:cytochrome oxidase Cu insertion factor (SCO1/SenC/PrrC family)
MKKHPVDLRVLLSLLALVVLGGGIALIAVGSSAAPKKHAAAGQAGFDASGLLSPVAAAPPLTLRNQLGQPFTSTSTSIPTRARPFSSRSSIRTAPTSVP